jgi:hypothetical protein
MLARTLADYLASGDAAAFSEAAQNAPDLNKRFG